ncbi:hypothetical protein ACH5RR_013408 [Cinchona calisaya]|uniref:Uncharacterized protein n=1 Tax=Cinchona calisaya TaxID=153742 RepID=A0ABD2ZZZ2_9GENT
MVGGLAGSLECLLLLITSPPTSLSSTIYLRVALIKIWQINYEKEFILPALPWKGSGGDHVLLDDHGTEGIFMGGENIDGGQVDGTFLSSGTPNEEEHRQEEQHQDEPQQQPNTGSTN